MYATTLAHNLRLLRNSSGTVYRSPKRPIASDEKHRNHRVAVLSNTVANN